MVNHIYSGIVSLTPSYLQVWWSIPGTRKRCYIIGDQVIFTYNDRSSVIARKLQANQPGEKLTSWIDGGLLVPGG